MRQVLANCLFQLQLDALVCTLGLWFLMIVLQNHVFMLQIIVRDHMEEMMQAYSSAYYRPAGTLLCTTFTGRDEHLSPGMFRPSSDNMVCMY